MVLSSPRGEGSGAGTRGSVLPAREPDPRGSRPESGDRAPPRPPSRPSRADAAAARRRGVLAVRSAVWIVGLLPLALLGWEAGRQGLGANPIERLLLHSGYWALLLLVGTLAVTPLRRLTGVNALVQARRPLGLFAFFYVTLHVLTYVGLDQFFAWAYIVEDVVERPFITVGFLAFLLLVPLAVTSTRGWIRRLGKNWTRLHRLVYPAAVLAAIHYQWKVKTEEPSPIVLGAILGVLLGARAVWALRARWTGSGDRPRVLRPPSGVGTEP